MECNCWKNIIKRELYSKTPKTIKNMGKNTHLKCKNKRISL